MNPYSHSLEHIKEELNLLDLRLKLAIHRFKDPSLPQDQRDLAGIIISDQEIQGILRTVNYPKYDSSGDKYKDKKNQKTKIEESAGDKKPPTDQKIGELLAMIDVLENNINDRRKLSRENKIHLSLDHVSKILFLSPFEYYALIICLAPEIDIKYEKLYAYLQDDITKKRPTLELVLRILSTRFEDRIKIRNSLVNSNFFNYNVIEYADNQQNILSRPLKLDDKVVNHILGINYLDSILEGLLEVHWPQQKEKPKNKYDNQTTNIPSFEDLKIKLMNYFNASIQSSYDNNDHAKDRLASCICLIGKDNSGRKTLVKSVLKEVEFVSPLLILDLGSAKGLSTSLDEIFKALMIEANLLEASLYLDDFNSMLTEENETKNIQILKRVFWHLKHISNKQVILIAGQDDTDNNFLFHHSHFPNNNFLQLKLPDLTIEDRIRLWTFFLQKFNLTLQDEDEQIKQIASKFNFTVGQIKNAINVTINISKSEKTGLLSNTILSKDLHKACIYESNKKLDKLAVKMDKDFYLKDIILPIDRKTQLEDIINYVKNKNEVYYEWGFKEKMGLGSGLNILFTGESGTGKTMAAQILANELEMEIFKIDLSLLVSKYIGETEKNINRIFHEAKTSNAMIFFDEADAIFGKRTEIKDAHDRYANVEVSYLLQKLEEHDEIVILASNLKHNIDDAFIRRLHFIVEFPFPNEKERLEIWKNVFPKPPSYLNEESVDLEFLAGQFKTSGAMIRSIAISAAFLAASESSKIEMKHLIRATKRELEKKGKPILKADFGGYFDLI